MSEYAYMPLSDYEDACDAIRAKTGESGLLKSGDLATAIGSISGGGGNTMSSDFFDVYKETVEVGENTVTKSNGYQTYLMSLISIPGSFLAMSIHSKESYVYNEYANGYGGSGYRYRSGWSSANWNNNNYDAVAPVGTIVDVYTYQLKDPADV